MTWVYKYVVADDERLIRTSLIKQIYAYTNGLFQLHGETADGLEALRIVENSTADIVFSDVRMPGMNGLELSKYISERFPWVKVVLISGYSDFEYVRKALHYGVCDYLLKPIHPEKLAQALDNLSELIGREEEKELAVLLALIEGEEEPHRELWKQQLLKQESREVIAGIRVVLSKHIAPLANRPRIMHRLFSLWSDRFLRKTGLAVSEPFFRHNTNPNDWFGTLSWEEALHDWITLICAGLHQYPPSTGHKAVHDVKQLIHNRYAENLTLEDLAAAAYLNKTYLAGLFKQLTGLTIGQYIQEVRMKRACLLLETTRKKIHEIAESTGYHDLSHFSKTFKQHFGVTPQVYRNITGVSPGTRSGHEQKPTT